ncbi:hypothetical protein T439DRAFT_67288 [Meredithblackwellia eburnea MCA 4105]
MESLYSQASTYYRGKRREVSALKLEIAVKEAEAARASSTIRPHANPQLGTRKKPGPPPGDHQERWKRQRDRLIEYRDCRARVGRPFSEIELRHFNNQMICIAKGERLQTLKADGVHQEGSAEELAEKETLNNIYDRVCKYLGRHRKEIDLLKSEIKANSSRPMVTSTSSLPLNPQNEMDSDDEASTSPLEPRFDFNADPSADHGSETYPQLQGSTPNFLSDLTNEQMDALARFHPGDGESFGSRAFPPGGFDEPTPRPHSAHATAQEHLNNPVAMLPFQHLRQPARSVSAGLLAFHGPFQPPNLTQEGPLTFVQPSRDPPGPSQRQNSSFELSLPQSFTPTAPNYSGQYTVEQLTGLPGMGAAHPKNQQQQEDSEVPLNRHTTQGKAGQFGNEHLHRLLQQQLFSAHVSDVPATLNNQMGRLSLEPSLSPSPGQPVLVHREPHYSHQQETANSFPSSQGRQHHDILPQTPGMFDGLNVADVLNANSFPSSQGQQHHDILPQTSGMFDGLNVADLDHRLGHLNGWSASSPRHSEFDRVSLQTPVNQVLTHFNPTVHHQPLRDDLPQRPASANASSYLNQPIRVDHLPQQQRPASAAGRPLPRSSQFNPRPDAPQHSHTPLCPTFQALYKPKILYHTPR